MNRLFLLDAYALIYRAYYAMIRAPRFTSGGFNTSAIFGFVKTLEDIIRHYHPTHIGAAFDPGGRTTFRHEAYSDYKAQREATPEVIRQSTPIIKDILRAYRIPLLEVPRFEADDVVGTIAFQAQAQGFETYMVTPDKDYGQLVGPNVWQLKPGAGGFQQMGPAEVCAKYGIDHTCQVIDILGLMGDSSDNVPGCPGVGEKTAVSLIKRYESIEGIYDHIDEITGKLRDKLKDNREQVAFSKFLVTIRRDVPVTLDADALSLKQPDRPVLTEIFSALEFRSLLRSVCNIESDDLPPTSYSLTPVDSPAPQESKNDEITEKNEPTQLSLFDAEPEPEVAAPATEPQPAPEAEPEESRPDPSITEPADIDATDYTIIQTDAEARQLVEQLSAQPSLAIEIATTTLAAINAEIIGISFATADSRAFYINCNVNDAQSLPVALFRPLFESEGIVKVGHDLKFLAIALSRYSIRLCGPLFDTMLAHYLCQPELNHSLNYLGSIFLHHNGLQLESYFGVHWQSERNMLLLPDDLRSSFACERARMAALLRPRLLKELHRLGSFALFDQIEMPLVLVLARMEINGVRIDSNALREASHHFAQMMQRYEEAVYAEVGHRFNIASPKQVGDVLFGELKLIDKPKRTPKGQYKTSEPVLESLRARFPVVDNLLNYREVQKLLSTYLNALPLLVNPRTGLIHTSFNQAVTATGRLSSSNPNLQNIPVRSSLGREIRTTFVPDDGHLFFSADYSQIELRIMAHLSHDPHMIEAFRTGTDIHAATAAHIYRKRPDQVTAEERRKAKTANFGIIYGITAFGLAERIGISRSESKQLIESYFAAFPGVRAFMTEAQEQARQRGYIETLFGRRRYLPDITSKNAVVRGVAERNAINAPIQGSAADIIKIAMVRIQQRLDEEHLRAKMILQVHDELNFSVPPEERQRVEQIVCYEMEHAASLSVPLVADCGWGTNWLEAH